MIVDVSHSVCYNVVKVFSLNRIISLAERPNFCSLLQASSGLEKMFSLQSSKVKTVWENVYLSMDASHSVCFNVD